jgi:hypothetical protein
VWAAIIVFALSAARGALSQGAPVGTLSVLASAGGLASAGAGSVQATFGEAVVHGPSAVDPSLAGGYWRTPLKDRDEIACGLLAGQSNVFHLTRFVTGTVEASGPGTLHCLRIRRTDAAHPQALPGVDPTAYWTLDGFDAAGLPASGFSLTVTLPHPGYGNPFACRWNATQWDCAQTSFDATTITRGGVVALSDWVVADHAVPVDLIRFRLD